MRRRLAPWMLSLVCLLTWVPESGAAERVPTMRETSPLRMRLVFLSGEVSLIEERVATREGHFLPKELLPSQFAALEIPEGGLVVDVARSPGEIVKEIRDSLGI